jgi:hypothetical protein
MDVNHVDLKYNFLIGGEQKQGKELRAEGKRIDQVHLIVMAGRKYLFL